MKKGMISLTIIVSIIFMANVIWSGENDKNPQSPVKILRKERLNCENIYKFLSCLKSGEIDSEKNYFEITLEGSRGFYSFPQQIPINIISQLIDTLKNNISSLIFSNYLLEETFSNNLESLESLDLNKKLKDCNIEKIEFLSCQDIEHFTTKYWPKNLKFLFFKDCYYKEIFFTEDLSMQESPLIKFSIKLNQHNIQNFITNIKYAKLKNILKNFSFELIIDNSSSFYLDQYRISYPHLKEIIKCLEKNLTSLALINFNINEIFYINEQENLFSSFKNSAIKTLLIQNCHNISNSFFENLPQNLIMFIAKARLFEESFATKFVFPKTLETIDLQIMFNADEQFFKSIPNGTKKLKLSCTIKDSSYLRLLPESITTLCLKKAHLENLDSSHLPKNLKKLCLSKNTKSCKLDTLPETVSSLDFTEINTNNCSELNLHEIKNQKVKFKISPEAILLLSIQNLKKIQQNSEFIIKATSCSFDIRSENTSEINSRIETLKKYLSKLTVIQYTNPALSILIPSGPFVSNSELSELESQDSQAGGYKCFSPDPDFTTPRTPCKSPISPKKQKSDNTLNGKKNSTKNSQNSPKNEDDQAQISSPRKPILYSRLSNLDCKSIGFVNDKPETSCKKLKGLIAS